MACGPWMLGCGASLKFQNFKGTFIPCHIKISFNFILLYFIYLFFDNDYNRYALLIVYFKLTKQSPEAVKEKLDYPLSLISIEKIQY